MRTLILRHMSLKHFKGITSLEVPIGELTAIKGDNATGKTTIYDALTYLLFGKDSKGRSEFEVQPLDEKGQVIHHLTTEVKALFEWEGKALTLSRVLTEKWQRPTGQQEAVYKGTATSYTINEVPQRQKDYMAFINSLIDEDVFRLLTQPLAFEALPWREKRTLLFKLTGDLSDEAVIAGNAQLAGLSKLLGGRKIEDFKKVLLLRKKQLKEELELLPARMDELACATCRIDAAAYQQSLLREELVLQEMDTALAAGAEKAALCQQKTHALFEAEKQYEQLKRKAIQREQEQLMTDEQALKAHVLQQETLKQEMLKLSADKKRAEEMISHYNAVIDEGVKRLALLKSQWQQEKDKAFLLSPSDKFCTQCGQLLPQDQLDTLAQTARCSFEAAKAHHLQLIEAEAAREKQQMDALCDENKQCQQAISEGEADLSACQKALFVCQEESSALAARIDEKKHLVKALGRLFEKEEAQLSPEEKALLTEPERLSWFEEKKTLKAAIKTLQEALSRLTKGDAATLKTQRKQQQAKVDELKKVLAQAAIYARNQQRIKELEQLLSDKTKLYNKLEQQEFLLQVFMRTKVDLLEETINRHFKQVTFKLFDEQINGGLSECCESMIHGVPFSNANHAAQLHAGLDIIAAFSRYYDFAAPIFIDNAESVTHWEGAEGQLIRLEVTKDPVLTYEGKAASGQ